MAAVKEEAGRGRLVKDEALAAAEVERQKEEQRAKVEEEEQRKRHEASQARLKRAEQETARRKATAAASEMAAVAKAVAQQQADRERVKEAPPTKASPLEADAARDVSDAKPKPQPQPQPQPQLPQPSTGQPAEASPREVKLPSSKRLGLATEPRAAAEPMRRPLGVPTSKAAAPTPLPPPPPPTTAANPPASSTKRAARQVAAVSVPAAVLGVPAAAPQPNNDSGRGLPSVGAQAGAPRPVARCVLAPFGSHALGGAHPFEAPQQPTAFAQPDAAAVATSSAPVRHAQLGGAPRPPVGGRPVASPLSEGAWPPGQPLERSSLSGVSDLYDADATIAAPPMPGQRANTSGSSDLYDATIAERAALSVLDDFDFGEGLDLGGGGLPPLPAPAASSSSSTMASFFGDLDSPADSSALEGRSARETRALLDEKLALQQRMEELEMKLRS